MKVTRRNNVHTEKLQKELYSALIYKRTLEKLCESSLLPEEVFYLCVNEVQSEISELVADIALSIGDIQKGSNVFLWSNDYEIENNDEIKPLNDIWKAACEEVEQKWNSVAM